MKRILYFNITYLCNNHCSFCFSHNVGTGRPELPYQQFRDIMLKEMPDNEDLLVINGGEPAIHKEFRQFTELIKNINVPCYIYSNGTNLNSFTYPVAVPNIHFIIPIHGSENIHDTLTNRKHSFRETISSLQHLNHIHAQYSIKFILSEELINSEFSIQDFLPAYDLQPDTIYISRMNKTIKSRENAFSLPDMKILNQYLHKTQIQLKSHYHLKYIDFPPCMLMENTTVSPDISNIEQVEYYFNDCEFIMQNRVYTKERLHLPHCRNCRFSQLCDLLSSSYYVIGQNDGESYQLQIE